MKTADFCEITIEIFLNLEGQMPFDVYVQLGPDKFTRVFKRNDLTDRNRIENYLKKGAQQLFIHRKDRRDYIGATEQFIKKLLREPPVPMKDAIRAVEELTEQTLYEIFEDRLFDEESLRWAQETVKSYIQILRENPALLSQFLHLARNETYMIRHSIATSVFSLLLGKSAENNSDRILHIIGTGALIHDLGMSQLPQELNDVDRKFSGEEWAVVKTHCDLGSKATEDVRGFPHEMKLVVEQHHEFWDGSGYPKGLKGEEIFYPARVVAIADCFSSLTTRRGGRSLFSPEDAMALMTIEKHRYDSRLLAHFESLLNRTAKKKTA
jgi:HD-GYP domain-containing protein (c-di-GMP phosphodiesterase class II)